VPRLYVRLFEILHLEAGNNGKIGIQLGQPALIVSYQTTVTASLGIAQNLY
jgi:hypothetical protein